MCIKGFTIYYEKRSSFFLLLAKVGSHGQLPTQPTAKHIGQEMMRKSSHIDILLGGFGHQGLLPVRKQQVQLSLNVVRYAGAGNAWQQAAEHRATWNKKWNDPVLSFQGVDVGSHMFPLLQYDAHTLAQRSPGCTDTEWFSLRESLGSEGHFLLSTSMFYRFKGLTLVSTCWQYDAGKLAQRSPVCTDTEWFPLRESLGSFPKPEGHSLLSTSKFYRFEGLTLVSHVCNMMLITGLR